MNFEKYKDMAEYVMQNIVTNMFFTHFDDTRRVKATCVIGRFFCHGEFYETKTVQAIGTDLEETYTLLTEKVISLLLQDYIIKYLCDENGNGYYSLADITRF